VINENDAAKMYPQGHGDAWGHYLTALTTYYKLLRHPYFTWENRAEAVLVGASPVQVDYLDERKFATMAAAKAKAGAEIVNLTYRSAYVEDPAGQWQGYKDTNADRGWGLAEWAKRSGQAAYFDWVVANSLLPDVDPLSNVPCPLAPLPTRVTPGSRGSTGRRSPRSARSRASTPKSRPRKTRRTSASTRSGSPRAWSRSTSIPRRSTPA
jgi:hypothetical protein